MFRCMTDREKIGSKKSNGGSVRSAGFRAAWKIAGMGISGERPASKLAEAVATWNNPPAEGRKATTAISAPFEF